MVNVTKVSIIIAINNKRKDTIDAYISLKKYKILIPPFVATPIRNFSCESRKLAGFTCPFSPAYGVKNFK